MRPARVRIKVVSADADMGKVGESRRTNPGKVALYEAAGEVLREERADLVKVWVAFALLIAFVNLPWFPLYERGLVTGVLATGLVCGTLWVIWYASGLGHRLEGTWAEGFTAEELDKVTGAVRVIPNLRFDGFDVDHVVVARHGVYVIETKKHSKIYDQTMKNDLYQAASNGRSVRLDLTKAHKLIVSPPEGFFCNLLVIWGRAGRDILPTCRETPKGDVILVGGPHLADWLSQQGRGSMSTHDADSIADAILTIAEAREAKHAPDSRLMRYLARTR